MIAFCMDLLPSTCSLIERKFASERAKPMNQRQSGAHENATRP